MRLSYEEFVTHPERTLRAVTEWLGTDYAQECLVFDNTSKSHAAGGNPARFELAGGIRGVDERWRQELSADELATFDRLAGAQNRKFAYE